MSTEEAPSRASCSRISARSAAGTGSPDVMTSRTSAKPAAVRRVKEAADEARHAPQDRRAQRARPSRSLRASELRTLNSELADAGEPVHHRQAGNHGGAHDAQERAGREIGDRVEVRDAVARPHALGLVAAARLVPDRVGVVRGVVERRRLPAGGAGRVGDVPDHALRRDRSRPADRRRAAGTPRDRAM